MNCRLVPTIQSLLLPVFSDKYAYNCKQILSPKEFHNLKYPNSFNMGG